MRAVVVEVRNHMAAVLTDDGLIVKTRNDHYAIGDEIELKTKTNRKKIVAFAASFLTFFLLCGSAVWAYAAPYSYVSLDVNPSIEYTLNIFDRVLHVNAVNDDGEQILQQTQLKNMGNLTIEAAIRQTVQQIAQNGYFSGSGAIVITTSSQNQQRAHELAVNLKQDAENIAKRECSNDVEVQADSVGYDRVQEAKTLGVTPGKLNLVERLKESSSDPDRYDLDEWLGKPVKEIMKAIKNNRASVPEEQPTETTTAPVVPSPEVSESPVDSNAEPDVSENTDKQTPGKANANSHSNQKKSIAKKEPSASPSPSPACSPSPSPTPSESVEPSSTPSKDTKKEQDRQKDKQNSSKESPKPDKEKNGNSENNNGKDKRS